MEETPISRIMIQNPMTTSADTPLARGGGDPPHHEVRRAAGGGDGRVVGILTDNDLIGASSTCSPAGARKAGRGADGCARGRPSEDADVETSSDAYARRFAGPVGALVPRRAGRARPSSSCAPGRGASVLDVGGGHGQVTGPLVDAGYAVTRARQRRPPARRACAPWTDAGRARFQSGDLLTPALRRPVVRRRALLSAPAPRRARGARWSPSCAALARSRGASWTTRRARSVNAVAGAFFGLKKRVEGNTRPFAVFARRRDRRAFAAAGFRRDRAAAAVLPAHGAPPRARARPRCRAGLEGRPRRARPDAALSARRSILRLERAWLSRATRASGRWPSSAARC